jgi:hypothetical protein
MKIVKTCNGTYYVLDSKDRAMAHRAMSLKKLVVNICQVEDYLERKWKPAMGVAFKVLLEFDTVEEVRKVYPELLV